MSEPYRTTPVPHEGYPPGIPFIVGNEAAERFSFYGMKVLLTFYFVDILRYTDLESTSHVHHFNFAVYFLPVLGGLIADRFWGKYRTIMVLSLVYCVGHAILSAFDEYRWGAFCGLGCIALGAGGIKPCVSAHVGDQFAKGEENKLEKIFSLFYFMINFGAGFSQILIPIAKERWGYRWAFAIPGILMGLATFVFWSGRYRFVHVPPSGPNPDSFFRVVTYACRNRANRPAGSTWLDAAHGRFAGHVVDGVRAVIGVMGVFILVAIFWSLQDQMATTWTFQANRMDLHLLGPNWLLSDWFWKEGLTAKAEQVQSINAFLVLALIPVMTYGIYPLMGRMGFEMTPLRRMSLGMFVMVVSFVLAGLIQIRVDRGETLSIYWQVPGYIILTIAEVLVSITGLEFAYTQAPRSMKSTLMSFWLLTIAVGNFMVPLFLHISEFLIAALTWLGIVAAEAEKKGVIAADFFVFAGLMLLAAIAFTWNARRYKPVNFMEPAATEEGDAGASAGET